MLQGSHRTALFVGLSSLLLAAGWRVREEDALEKLQVEDLRCGKNERQRYFLIRPAKEVKAPKEGFGLLLVLPGGDGSAEFHGFVKTIAAYAAGDQFLVAQLVAPKWKPEQVPVWPTRPSPLPKAEFTTEEFVKSVVAEVAKSQKIDASRVYQLCWSSSGPAGYVMATEEKTPIRGSIIAMSVFHGKEIAKIQKSKGRPFFLLHSPEDTTCPIRLAEEAETALTKAGAVVTFERYSGGHGWTFPVHPTLRRALAWLDEKRAKK
ncbi:MAG: hypothetical protein JNJ88_00450 [Planctomycetes bacterium]|nr:hypothetical protein [Planctomycetota bacterium]